MNSNAMIDVEPDTLVQLDRLAADLSRPRRILVEEALRSYVEEQNMHLQQIREGIASADRGEFADASEVARIVNKYK
jgi:predicted transcriptional regulator